MILKFVTKKGYEGELEITDLISVDGVPYRPTMAKQEELTERVYRLEGAVDLLLQIMQPAAEGEE